MSSPAEALVCRWVEIPGEKVTVTLSRRPVIGQRIALVHVYLAGTDDYLRREQDQSSTRQTS